MIGVFDSGVGGLTVLKAMREAYSSIDVVYFGDTKNAPYGERSKEELSALTVGGIHFLLAHGANTVVSACNSVSASLAVSIFDVLALPPSQLIEMVGPCVSSFKGSNARVALVATRATVESGMYQGAFRMIGKEIQAVAIPALAGAIERGAEDEYEPLVREALAALPEDSYDVLILGCTHYPLIADMFKRIVGDKIIFDPAEAVAARVKRDFWPREMGYGTTKFYISKDSAHFRALVDKLFPVSSYSIEIAEAH